MKGASLPPRVRTEGSQSFGEGVLETLGIPQNSMQSYSNYACNLLVDMIVADATIRVRGRCKIWQKPFCHLGMMFDLVTKNNLLIHIQHQQWQGSHAIRWSIQFLFPFQIYDQIVVSIIVRHQCALLLLLKPSLIWQASEEGGYNQQVDRRQQERCGDGGIFAFWLSLFVVAVAVVFGLSFAVAFAFSVASKYYSNIHSIIITCMHS